MGEWEKGMFKCYNGISKGIMGLSRGNRGMGCFHDSRVFLAPNRNPSSTLGGLEPELCIASWHWVYQIDIIFKQPTNINKHGIAARKPTSYNQFICQNFFPGGFQSLPY
jgi:hypothetical protein